MTREHGEDGEGDPRVGTQWDQWHLEAEVATRSTDAVARVFQATGPAGRAAVKIFATSAEQAGAAEQAALATLDHPAFPRVLGSGRSPWWIATEWVEGQSLDQAAAAALAAPLLAQILAALAHAHSRGIVHGDLRPANILVDAEGRVSLVDLGLGGRPESRASRVSGTLAYLAPERLAGAPPSPASDLFAVGAIFVETLAGRDALSALQNDRERNFTWLARQPAALTKLVRELVARDPAARPPGAGESLERLLPLLPSPLPGPLAHLVGDARLRPAAASTEPTDPPLVGRDAALSQIEGVLRATAEGRGTFVVVTAEAGLGRTRLLAETASRARAWGVRALAGRCRHEAAERGPWREILLALLPDLLTLSAAEVAGLVTTDARALGIACPEMLELAYVRTLPDPPDLSPDLEKFRVFSAATGLLRAWSRRQPLVLLIDDIQWADDATLELVYYLQRNVVHGAATFGEAGAGGALSIMLARRHPSERESELLERTLSGAQRGGMSMDITLPRLGPDHVRDLVAGMLAGSPIPRELSDLIAAEAGGSPQVAVELVRTLHGEGLIHRVKGEWRFVGAHGSASGQLADVLRRRLGRVEAEPRQLLVAAALIGQEFDLEVAAEAAGIQQEAAEPAVRQLLEARLILRPGDGALRCSFVHEQLRHLLLDQLDAAERAERHLAVARALARRGASSAELARHHVAAGDVTGALEHLPKAAAVARSSGNPLEALAFLSEQIDFLEKLPREERTRRTQASLAARQAIAEILQRLARYAESAAAWTDLLTACRLTGDAGAEARALVGLGGTANLAGEYGEAREHLVRALALADEQALPDIALTARIYLVQNAYMRGRFDEGEPQVAAVRAALPALRDRALTAEALRQIGLFHHFRGRSDEAIPLYREALGLLAATGDRGTTAKTLHNLGILHNSRGEHDVAMDCYERSLVIFRELGLRIEQAKCLSNIGNIRLQQGSPSEAERCYAQAQTIYRELGDRRSEAENLSNLGEVDARRGEWRRARDRHRQALAVHRDLGNGAGIAYACYELAVTHLALGRLEEARPLVAEALERDRELGNPRGLAYDLAASALLHQLSGDDEQALREYGLALEEARKASDRYHAALLLGDLAWQYIVMGRLKDAQVHAAHAHLEATSLGAREAEAVALLAQARATGSVSNARASQERIERALELAQRTENPEVQWRAWQCAALLPGERAGRAAAAMDRALDLIGDVARRLGDEAPSFLARRDVRRVLDDSLDLEERSGPRAESVLSRYHLLATEEQRGRAKRLLAHTLGDAPRDSRELRRLRTFHDVVTTSDVLSLEALFEAFTQRLLVAADADRGFIYLLKGRELTCRVAIARGGRELAAPEREVPRQVLEWVVRERASLVSEDVAADPRISWKDSVADLRVRSLLAAPLLEPSSPAAAQGDAPRDVWGVVYVDRRVTGASFSSEVREDFEAACDDLARLIGIAHRAEHRVDTARRLRADAPAAGLPGLVGTSGAMQKLFATARVAAASSANVLITGESGTGKEGLARALHLLSGRADGPFVAIDCGSIPSSLIESVLFGHVRGAFTGADRDRPGLFEEADRGTLFLDEITNASIDVQSRLLRVLQEREVRRVGGRGTIPIDVRIIAATNLNLDEEVATGRFRQDLFYRLDVIHLEVPRLSDRPEDIPLLAEHFLQQVVTAEKKPLDGFTEDALRILQSHSWPGNVRELANCVARMAAFCNAGRLGADRIPASVRGGVHGSVEVRLTPGPGHEGESASGRAAHIVDSMAAGQANFWEAVRAPLRSRSLTLVLAQEIIAEGLRRTGGSYRAVLPLFGLPSDDYGRFMDFLRFNKLKLDFREYRPKK